MRIFQIVPDISYEANGVTPVVNGLASYLIKDGNQVSVCTLGANLSDNNIKFLKARRSALFNINEYSPDFSFQLKKAFTDYDIVHGHSLWSSCNLSTGIHAKYRTAKLVISPHGTLTEYALSRRMLLKKALWPIQRMAINRADLLHATAESEVDDIRRIGYRGPIALIPNGVEIPEYESPFNQLKRKKQVLFLGRIHPIKGIENLLHAWSNVYKQHPEWELVIAGIGASDYEHNLRNLSVTLKLQGVKWLGPVYGQKKAQIYKDSSLFILPSYSENFAMVVAEALAYGLPCIVSKGAPWSIINKIDAGWWIENDIDSLTNTLRLAFTRTDYQLIGMGLKGRDYVQTSYSWEHVGKCFKDAYNWINKNVEKPKFIIN